jgi:flagellar basal body-associated protein FliL
MIEKRRMTDAEGRKETRFIWVMVAVVVLILLMALFGYLTGRWEESKPDGQTNLWRPDHARALE